MTQNQFYPNRASDPRAYWAIWAGQLGWIRQWKRTEFDTFFKLLVECGIAHAEDRSGYDEYFTNTQRNKLNACAGLVMRFSIPRIEAARMDDQGRLVETVRTEMRRIAEAFGLHLPPSV